MARYRRDGFVNRRRELIVANAAALLVLLTVLLLGWWQEAAFGLAVLLFLDLFVLLRGRQARSESTDGEDQGSTPGEGGGMGEDLPAFTYEEVKQAYEGGHKLHVGGRIFLVRPALRAKEEGLVLWIADEQTRGDHGWLLFPDGRVEVK
jgi:membrane protein implicated in regulation of membrane protease activity